MGESYSTDCCPTPSVDVASLIINLLHKTGGNGDWFGGKCKGSNNLQMGPVQESELI